MKFKGTLGAVAAMLTMGTFYTFAFCMVEDVDENIISEEYYYSEETEFTEPAVTAAEAVSQKITEKLSESVTETVTSVSEEEETLTETRTEDREKEEETVVTTVPETEKTEEPETASAESEEEYPEVFEVDELDDGSTEAMEQSVYGADTNDGFFLSEEDDIDDPRETEAPETTVFEETESAETTAELPAEDDSNIIITFFDGDIKDFWPVSSEDEWYNTETSVSVNVGSGADVSTSETFTAKINGTAQTVNAYDLICQIVANEMSPSFSDEALKAQAVAAYSYVKYHNVNGLTPSVLVNKKPSERVKSLVSEVWGVCCYYNGSVAQTVYMASSSGYTTSAEHVWGGSVPYLKGVACPFDVGSDPNYGDTMNVSEDKMRNMLESCLGISLSNNPYEWLVIKQYIDGNYVYEISVDGQKVISGRKLRENVMGGSLKSAAFDVYYSDGYFYFTTYGYGHGVGMSQNGANILAKQGYSYVDILKHYFTGIEII